jgi:hypothetical protein
VVEDDDDNDDEDTVVDDNNNSEPWPRNIEIQLYVLFLHLNVLKVK